ncbi:uncharacterized protein [Argopecten irradians]|uniref:uncharacterized protein isoform X4 n=1 Tax=Argopecten irradians TaxID=31199 RepID=UPI0037146D36
MVAITSRITAEQFPVLPKPTYQPGSFDPIEDHRSSRPKGSNILHRQLKRLQRQRSIVITKDEKEEKQERLGRRYDEKKEHRPKDGYRKVNDRKGHRRVVSNREKSFHSSCTKLPDISSDKEEIFRRHSVTSLTSEETDRRLHLPFRNIHSKYSNESEDRIGSHFLHGVYSKYSDERDNRTLPFRSAYSKYSDKRDDRIKNHHFRTVYSKYSDDRDDRKLHHHRRTFPKYEYHQNYTEHSKYNKDGASYTSKLPDIHSRKSNELDRFSYQHDGLSRTHWLGTHRESLQEMVDKVKKQTDDNNDYYRLVKQRFGRQQRRRPRNLLRAKEKRRQCRNVFLKYSADLEDGQRLRRLGSGLLPPVVVDSHILTHMLSLLDGQKKKNVLDADFNDDKSSEHSGSFKGKARRSKGSKGRKSLSSSRDDKEYVGNVPVVAMRSGDSSPTTLPQIPGTMPLPPIGEASREQTNIPPVVLPPIATEAVPLVSVQPPTPQHTFLTPHGAQEPSLNTQTEEEPQDLTDGSWAIGQKALDKERRRKEEQHRRKRGEGPTVSGGAYLQSSSESLGAGSTGSIPVAKPIRTNWKGSNQSLRSMGSKKAESDEEISPENEIDARSGDEASQKGSIIFGPDGQVISVGGAIQPSPRIEATGMIDQVTDANRIFGKDVILGSLTIDLPFHDMYDLMSDESDDEPEEWKHSKALRRQQVMRREGSVKSQISEEDIVNALTEHAQQVAASVLSSKSETGKDLEADVRHAAEMWMERHPPRQISRSQSIQDNRDNMVIDEIIEIEKQKRKSAGPTAGEYRELIKESLTTAMKAQGLNENIPDDTEITPEVIEALTNGSLTPEDLELVHDTDSGRSVIRSRSQLANAMGGVKEGHIYVAGSKNAKKGPGSIPVDRTSNVDIGEFDVIKYGTASQSGSEKASSEKAMSEKAMSEKAPSERAPSAKAPSDKAPSEKVGKSQPPSIMGESIVEEPPEVVEADKKSTVSFQSEPQVDEFKKAVEEIEEQQKEPSVQEEEPKLPDEQRARSRKSNRSLQSRYSFQSHQSRCSHHHKSDISKKSDEKSTKSAKSRVSDKKNKVSDTTSQKGKSELEKRDEFVVGKVKQTNELEQLYGPVDPPSKEPSQPAEPVPQKKAEVPRKKADIPPKKPPEPPKKKEEPKKIVVNPPQEEEELSTIPEDGKPKDKKPKASPPLKKPKEKPKKGKGKAKAKKEEEKEPEPPPKEPTPPPPKDPTPPPPEPEVDAESVRESIVDSYKSEEESDFEFNIVRDSPSPEPVQRSLPSLPSYDDNTETENEDDEEDKQKKQDEAARLRQISNREARAAKRAAQAEKRRQEVDRRRRERDEQSKREKEEWERQELLKQELEEARKRNEENRRRRRELEAEENAKEAEEEHRRQQALLAEQEREKRRREEYQRKLEEMKRKQILEEQRRQEEQLRKAREEEERRIAEEEMLAKMAEEERLAYEEKKRKEEEERKRKEEEERIKREEEAKKAMEEARKLAEEMARRQAELEARLKFNHTIQVESSGMTHSQSMTRAFVFSYYELLSWLGLDIPEFELLKLNQY